MAAITAGALGIFVALRLLPTGTNLSHMDFRIDAKGANAIEFCDPLNPLFIPVLAARSPVTMTVVTRAPAAAGREVRATVTLKTGSGKPVAPEDLLVSHTRRLHLLIVDPTVRDYQHVHPEPARTPGEWTMAFTPRVGGTYRVFGDFTPAATGRGLYASVDLAVEGARSAERQTGAGDVRARPGVEETAPGGRRPPSTVEQDGYRFTLTTGGPVVRAGRPIDLRFAIVRGAGGAVPLEPVMGAFAHLVAFDEVRSGFAHLHPTETDLSKPPDARSPVLNFKLTIPRAGHYVIWAQMKIGGFEAFVPFGLEVVD